MMLEELESRCLLSTIVNVTAKGAAAYEAGVTPVRVFYIRRSIEDISKPLLVFYTIGGKATPGADYTALGTHVTIKAGTWLRRVGVLPIDDSVQEANESVAL